MPAAKSPQSILSAKSRRRCSSGWSTRDGGVTELLNNPFMRAYRDDPRFIAFAQKIGVMPKRSESLR
jgi:hypothetical protein